MESCDENFVRRVKEAQGRPRGLLYFWQYPGGLYSRSFPQPVCGNLKLSYWVVTVACLAWVRPPALSLHYHRKPKQPPND